MTIELTDDERLALSDVLDQRYDEIQTDEYGGEQRYINSIDVISLARLETKLGTGMASRWLDLDGRYREAMAKAKGVE